MKVPVHLGRRPFEPLDDELRAFYRRLLPAAAALSGEWRLCTAENVVAWAWERHLVVVNLTGQEAQGHVETPWDGDVSAHRPADRHETTNRGRRPLRDLGALGRPPLPMGQQLTGGFCTPG